MFSHVAFDARSGLVAFVPPTVTPTHMAVKSLKVRMEEEAVEEAVEEAPAPAPVVAAAPKMEEGTGWFKEAAKFSCSRRC